MTEPNEIAELRNLPEAELVELLPAADAAKLEALREAEAGDEKPRKKVLAAIDKAIKALPESGQRTDTEIAAAAGKTGDALPAWQAEAYDGPLTIPQAEWRRRNIKPVREARTK